MRTVAAIDELLFEEIGERRYDPSRHDRDDILSMLVTPQPHEAGFMSDREVRDEILTLLIAGHETTATALSWTFERLLRNPVALERLPRGDRGRRRRRATPTPSSARRCGSGRCCRSRPAS